MFSADAVSCNERRRYQRHESRNGSNQKTEHRHHPMLYIRRATMSAGQDHHNEQSEKFAQPMSVTYWKTNRTPRFALAGHLAHIGCRPFHLAANRQALRHSRKEQ